MKVIDLNNSTSEEKASIMKEARLLDLVRHPNIVRFKVRLHM